MDPELHSSGNHLGLFVFVHHAWLRKLSAARNSLLANRNRRSYVADHYGSAKNPSAKDLEAMVSALGWRIVDERHSGGVIWFCRDSSF